MSEKTAQDAICQALLNAFPMADKVADGYAAVAVKAIATPSLPAQEPVAWEGYWPGAGSIDSVTRLTSYLPTMEKWKADEAEITPLYASPQPEASVTDEMVERGAEGLRKMYHGDEDEPFHLMAKAVLTAALILPTHKPLQEEG